MYTGSMGDSRGQAPYDPLHSCPHDGGMTWQHETCALKGLVAPDGMAGKCAFLSSPPVQSSLTGSWGGEEPTWSVPRGFPKNSLLPACQ